MDVCKGNSANKDTASAVMGEVDVENGAAEEEEVEEVEEEVKEEEDDDEDDGDCEVSSCNELSFARVDEFQTRLSYSHPLLCPGDSGWGEWWMGAC